MIRLGFHLSIAGAISNSAREAAEMSYGAFQLFTTSSRSWKNSELDPTDCNQFIKSNSDNKIIPYAHMPYLCNLASSNEDVYKKSIQMLADNINNCNKLKVECLVVHIGSHLGSGTDNGIKRVCNALRKTLDSTEKVTILLENGSGYNNSVGSKFEEIGKILDNVSDPRIRVCFDTCHAFAAGYDLRTDEAVEKTIALLDSAISFSSIKLVHLNDAKHELGSGLDRHWNIGKGHIGRNGFVSLFGNKNFREGSFVMETPVSGPESHENDMAAITSIIKEATR